ncbi:MAG: hypothetical protein ACUZ8H_15815 [Candidatus Anammoxibacter sp.]
MEKYLLERDGLYFTSTNLEDGRYIAKSTDKSFLDRWVIILNDNSYAEEYMTSRKFYGL